MRKYPFLILALMLGLTAVLPAFAQEDDLTETYTSELKDIVIHHPEGWQVIEDEGLLFLLNGDEDILRSDTLASGEALMAVLTPNFMTIIDMDAEAPPAEVAEAVAMVFATDEGEIGEVEAIEDAENEMVILPVFVEAGDGLIAVIAFDAGTVALFAAAPVGELDDIEDTLRAIFMAFEYHDPQNPEVPEDNAISWETDNASLRASNFYIVAGGKVFTADVDDIEVDGDPGTDTYTTLEVTWQEHGVEMRVYIYFEADDEEWKVYEIRTYDGSESGEWVYYEDQDFGAPLGESYGVMSFGRQFVGNQLVFSGLDLQAFSAAE